MSFRLLYDNLCRTHWPNSVPGVISLTVRQVLSEFFQYLINANDVKTNSLSWEKVLHPDSLQGFHAMIDNLRQSKENTGYWEYKAKDSRNEYSWLMGVYQVTAWDANGEPLKIAGLQIDISEYKKCESEKNDALNIINCFFLNSNDGVALFDEKGVTVEWNKTMEQITGISGIR